MDKKTLIGLLPPYNDAWMLIHQNQNVSDIVNEVLNAHKEFAPYYNKIALCFDSDNVEDICSKLYNFCKDNINYQEESEEDQTSALPTGILIRGYGDCKHYAGFCGGVLDGINRLAGKKIKWNYRFASYNVFDSTPHHVFIVVHDNGDEIWIDPTPGAGSKTPNWQIDKKIKGMPLHRNISGIEDDLVVDSETQEDIPAEQLANIQLLLNYGLLNEDGLFNDTRLLAYQATLPDREYEALMQAWLSLQQAASVTGFFSGIWRGIKKISLLIPRTAYLGVVSLNIFGTATKLSHAISTQEGADKIRDIWYKLGGDWKALEQTIISGAKKKKIGNNEVGYVAGGTAALLASAAAIIGALTPIITSILNKQKDQGILTDMSLLDGQFGQTTTSDPVQWIQSHLLEVALIGMGGYFLLKKKKSVTGIKDAAPLLLLAAGGYLLLRSRNTQPQYSQAQLYAMQQSLINHNPNNAAQYIAMGAAALANLYHIIFPNGINNNNELTPAEYAGD